MNKIIVVGHPQSGFERVEELLLACGMSQALPSRREGFTPAQISETLVKAHGKVLVQQLRKSDELLQIEVAPVWQGLALDLMLANMEQSFWGWADTQAVYLLDYWKEQDPQTLFVLVYDSPETVLTRHAVEHLDTDPVELEAKINAWMAYNSALLSFHLRNVDRSLLVHVGQVQIAAPHYLQQLSARVDSTLQMPRVPKRSEGHATCIVNADDVISLNKSEAIITNFYETAVSDQSQQLQSNALEQWLAQQLIEEHHEAGELFEQLQAAGNMPLKSHQQSKALLATHDRKLQCHRAWTFYAAQQAVLEQSATRLLQLAKTLQDRQQQQQQSNLQIEKLQHDNLCTQHRIQEQERLLSSHTVALQLSEQENSLLLEQLHSMQEELEKHYRQNLDQSKILAELPKVQADLKAAEEKATKLQLAEAANQKLQVDLKALKDKFSKLQQTELQLKQELQEAVSRSTAIELQQENELLMIQLHKMQEELEHHYRDNSRFKEEQRSSPEEVLYGAADRVKQQLCYRLGATMIKHSRSIGGWLYMPFALNAEVKRFKLDQLIDKDVNLLPIDKYHDSHEAELIKQHLSYRLGFRLLTSSKTLTGWISLPWSLYAEVKAFRKERQLH